MFYVYVLQSELKNQIYVGSTKDLRRRLAEHNLGKEISTKRYMPWKLIYYEAFSIEKFARDREMKLKYNGNAMKELKKRIGLDLSSTSLAKQEINKVNLGRSLINPKKRVRLSTGAGFTLVELLITMGIIGVLAASLLVLVDPVAQMQRARDSKIKSNMAQIQTALELYRSDCGQYPGSISSGGPISSITCAAYAGPTITYLQTIPTFTFTYTPGGSNQTYTIISCLERNDTSEGTILHAPCTTSHDRAYRVTSL